MADKSLLIERCIVGTQEVISYSVDAVVVQLEDERCSLGYRVTCWGYTANTYLTVVLDGRVESVVQFGIACETDVLLCWYRVQEWVAGQICAV